jgi:hypothetical protein
MCHKVPYPDQGVAVRVLARLIAQGGAERRVRVYRCMVCGLWHLSSGRRSKDAPPVPGLLPLLTLAGHDSRNPDVADSPNDGVRGSVV